MTAPVQVVVIGFDHPSFSGEVLAELSRLREAGVVRLVDLLLVSRSEDGTFETAPMPDGGGAGFGAVATALLSRDDGDLETDDDRATGWSLAAAVPCGSTAAVALIEHLWAEPLTAAIGRAGGTPLEETWLAADDLQALSRGQLAG